MRANREREKNIFLVPYIHQTTQKYHSHINFSLSLSQIWLCSIFSQKRNPPLSLHLESKRSTPRYFIEGIICALSRVCIEFNFYFCYIWQKSIHLCTHIFICLIETTSENERDRKRNISLWIKLQLD